MIESKIVQNKQLNLRLDNIRSCEDAIHVVKEFSNIIKYKKKRILNLEYKQEVLCNKIKESNRFKKMLKDIGISKSTIYFKVKLVKVLEKYLKFKIFLLLLNFIKIYSKLIKQVCKESGNEFNSFKDVKTC